MLYTNDVIQTSLHTCCGSSCSPILQMRTQAHGNKTVAGEELQPSSHIDFHGASPGSWSQCAPFFPLPV